MIRKIALIGFCALLVTGCGRDEEETTAPAQADSSAGQADVSSALFTRIDAEPAFLIANLEPVPEDLSEELWAPLQSMADFNSTTYNDLAEDLDESPVAAALLREFAQIDSREAFAERGLHPNGHWAFHSVALYPFAHWQLSDAEDFRAMLDRVTADAGEEVSWRDIEDAQVLWVAMEEGFGVAIAYDEQFATVALIPDNAALLRRVANLDQPARAYDASELADFSNSRGFTPYGAGFIEFGRIVDQLLDGDEEMLAAARESSPLGEIAGNAACRKELGALVDLFPRTSLGYTEISDSSMVSMMTVETNAEFAERLQALVDTPVELGDTRGGVFDFGLAINIVGARDFGRELVAGWVENPPQCEMFKAIRENAADWQMALNQPIPPVVTNFHGLRLSVDSIEMGEGSSVESAEATLAMFMRNPQMMLGMAQMFSPELASLQLEPGGEPQPVPAGVIPNLPAGIQAFIGLGEGGLGLAVGESQRDQLAGALEPGEGGNAMLTYGIDFAGYAQAMEGLFSGMQQQLEALGEEGTADPSQTMSALAELYDYSHMGIYLSDRGIELRSVMTLADQ
ncbi:MAG: hypothetical protein GVY32_05150 [Gammaproteobacteria bacterium]|jgi:hypothetical protein|nr:hypothetical protein [Gammaproteobacteria bacterium]